MRFVKVTFPEAAKGPIEANGGQCIGAWTCQYGSSFVGALLSIDPSGTKREPERHLSISASDFGHRRMPRRKEVREAMAVAGMSEAAEIQDGNECVHVYEPSLVSSR